MGKNVKQIIKEMRGLLSQLSYFDSINQRLCDQKNCQNKAVKQIEGGKAMLCKRHLIKNGWIKNISSQRQKF